MTIKEMRERRWRLAKEIRQLAELVNKENRDFTADEQERWDKLNDEYNVLTRKIEVAERGEQLDRDLSGPADPRGVGRHDLDPADPGGGAAARGAAGETWIDRRTGRPVPCFTRGDNRSVRDYFAQRRPDVAERYEGVSLGGLVRAWFTGEGDGREKRALAEGTDAAGGFTVPDLVAADVIDRLRANATVLQAGARLFPFDGTDNMTIARLNTDPALTWAAEGATVSPETSMDLAGTVLQPKTVRTVVKASRELLADGVNTRELIDMALTQAFAAELDRVALVGSGAGQEPTGLRTQTGVTELDLNGAALTSTDPWNEVLDLREDILDANGPDPGGPEGGAMIHHQRESTTLWSVVSGGDRLPPPSIFENVRMLVSQKIATDEGAGSNESSLFLASNSGWMNLIVGLRMPLFRLELKERYAEEFEIGFLAAMRLDVAMANAAAIGRLIGIIP